MRQNKCTILTNVALLLLKAMSVHGFYILYNNVLEITILLHSQHVNLVTFYRMSMLFIFLTELIIYLRIHVSNKNICCDGMTLYLCVTSGLEKRPEATK